MPFVVLNADGQTASRTDRSHLLRGLGYLVREVSSGNEAIACCGRECIAAAVVGMTLAEMSGDSLVRRLKSGPAASRSAVLLVARGSHADMDRAAAAACGADACLVEPLDAAVLGATIQWLAQRTGRSAPAPWVEDRWRAIVEALPQLVWVATPDGWTEYVSPQWTGYTGMPEWRSLGYGWLEAIHPGDREENSRAWQRAVATGEPLDFSHRIRRHDGEYRRFRTRGKPLRDAGGGVLRWLGSSEDIEDQARTRDELERRKSELTTVLDNLPVGVWFTDGEGRIVFGNPAGQRIWAGARYVPIPEYHEYKGWWTETGKRLEATDWALARALLGGETSINEMIDIECFDGTRKTILNSAVPVRTDARSIIGAVVINEDITERRRQEQALRTSRDRLDLVLNSIDVGVWYCDLPFDRLVWNEQCKRHFGLPPDAEVTIAEFYARLHPDDAGWIREAMADVIERREPFEAFFRTVGLDGETRWVRSIGRVFYRPDGTPARFDGITLNVTAQKRTEEALRASQARLKKANEALRRSNEDLRQFAHAASHDMQEPLRLVSIYAQWLERTYRDRLDEGANQMIGTITGAARRMRELLDSVLDYSEAAMIEKAGKERSDAEAVVRCVLEEMRPALEAAGAEVVCDPLPAVRMAAPHLASLIRHLVANAAKFRGESGQPRIRLSACRSGSEWVLSVTDNGPGIEPEYLDRIFSIFTRLHGQDVPGSGIGLAVCQKVVERYGGRIWAESEKGKGSTFFFTAPA